MRYGKGAPVPDLTLVFLLVSCISLAFQAAAFARLITRRPRTPVEGLVGGGYTRTVGCRVLAATVYVAVAAVQLAGAGTLTGEALIVFTAVQGLWVGNSLLDIRIRRTLTTGEQMPDEKQRLASIAAVTSELDQTLDRLYATVAQLKQLLVPPAPEPESKELAVSEDSSVLGSDPIQTAKDLQHALEGMTKQLTAVRATVRRGKRMIIALAVSLALDVALTAGVTVAAVQSGDASSRAADASAHAAAAVTQLRAIQAASHANQLAACQQANVNRTQDAAVLNQLLADLAPPAVRTPEVEAELAVLNRLIKAKDTPHDCAAVYRLP